MDPLPIVLPASPEPARRAPLPFMAAIVPVAAGIVLWVVSGSIYALCFAALGPLMILASVLDGARSRRRDRRSAEATSVLAWAAAEDELRARHGLEREALWRRYPDVATGLRRRPLRGALMPDALTEVVVGSGVVSITVRTSGGDGERVREFQRRCGALADSPVRVPLGLGICVRGPAAQSAAVARALVAQLCLRFGPSQLGLVGDRLDEQGFESFSQARSAQRGVFRLGIATRDERRPPADAMIWIVPTTDDVPQGITTVIDVVELRAATVRTPLGSEEIAVEGFSVEQVRQIGQLDLGSDEGEASVPALVPLPMLEQSAQEKGLPATIGRSVTADVAVDIVSDGPHAIVTGTTGTGKSELLVTWVTAIATVNGPDRVSFVLADFKGGTAFEPLRALPQVAAVITDLDEAGARRGVTSLTAEIRRREAVLAEAGARDIGEIEMPRLVIVVDEFAALVNEHPDLAGVFTDIAARGRALGMHLILGTQRASGVVREALAANCPLRVSLRVGDPAESRLMIGTTAASDILGGSASRGLGLVRRPQDAEPQIVRIAQTQLADVHRVSGRWAEGSRAPSPWLPVLPSMLPLDELRREEVLPADTLLLGRIDDPERQMQPLALLRAGADRGIAVVGAPGAGRTSLLRLLSVQDPRSAWISTDAEAAWDAVCAWTEGTASLPKMILCDDVDLVVAALPPEYAQEWLRRIEQLVRGDGETTFVMTAARASGAVGRLLEALPQRALMRMSSRVEHLAAGGEVSGFSRDRPAGRADIGGREVQFAWVDGDGALPLVVASPLWAPAPGDCGIVSAPSSALISRLRMEHPDREVVPLDAGAQVDGRGAVVVADADTWQRNLAVWRRLRAEGEVLIRAENPAELRQLAGVRDLPPYARLHAGRAWSLQGEGPPRRVVVGAFSPRIQKAAPALTRRTLRAERVVATPG